MTIVSSGHIAAARGRRRSAWFARVRAAVGIVVEALLEARQHQRAAHRRYPFADW